MNILVTGASGFIGARLVPELLQAGHSVRCLSRRPEGLRVPPQVERFGGDVRYAATLEKALSGIDAAYYLIHSMEQSRGEIQSFAERDRAAARSFAKAAGDAGVQRMIYLGGLGESGDQLSKHLKSRIEVGQILRSGKVPVTEFRAAIIVGAWGSSFRMIQALVERLPLMICPRWVETPCQPIALKDVLYYLVKCLEVPETKHRQFDIGGPDVLSYRDMMLRFAKLLKKRLLILGVPVLTPRLSSYWVNLVTPIRASLARPLIEGLRNPVVCRDKLVQHVMPHACMNYEASLQKAIDEQGAGKIIGQGTAYRLIWRQWVPHTREHVMAFFRNPKNLAPMTPPELQFDVLPPIPDMLNVGALLHYRLRLFGIPIRWTSEIVSLNPPEQFSDRQRSGPYQRWDHTHQFKTDNGGTWVQDEVDYELPLGPFARFGHPFMVGPLLSRVFQFRSQQLPGLLRNAA